MDEKRRFWPVGKFGRTKNGVFRGSFSKVAPWAAHGIPGQQGPPFANAIIDAVNTLNPGESATVSVSFDGSNVRFNFGIPRGTDGGQGQQGEQRPS